ncbi:sugar ABC transporter substrate-binding protein [bacterium]|nr:MAG: sugar ABC transporter substrate-binding protein [bacterium]
MKNPILFASALSLLAFAGCNNAAQNSAGGNTGIAQSPSDSSKPTIAVIPKGTTHAYWKSVEAGANKAGAELGANIVFKGPIQESDRASQIKIVDQFVTDGVGAVVLAPLDDAALVKPVREAKAKKIPVVIIDSALKAEPGVDYTAFVSTDNKKGGMLAGKELVRILGGKGKVVLLRYQEGSASTADREAGFLSAIKDAPGITLISDNRYAGATAGEAKTSALNLVDKLKEADGIFTPNESSTQGMLLALRQVALAGKKKFVGFDASPPLLEGLNKGEINALVAQNPTKMGYEGVKAAFAAIKGEKVEAQMDTGVAVVTKDNLNSAEVKEVLNENK